MKTLGYAGAFLLLLAEIAGAQQAPEIKPENRGQAQQAAAEPMVVPLAVGTAFNVKLITPIDARHHKAGDVFAVETVETVRYQGSVIFPRGTTIYGHLVRCTTSGHGHHGSGLFLQFDKAELKTGGEAVLNAGVQALAAGPNQPALSNDADADEELGLDGGDRGQPENTLAVPLDGVDTTRHVIGAVATIPRTAYEPPGIPLPPVHGTLTKHGLLTHDSQGAIGMPNVKVYTPLSPGSSGSVLLSNQKNLRLDAGTKLLLVIQPATASPDSK
jgi:hypothetical protein